MKACAVSVPLLCCSAPRAVRIIAGLRLGHGADGFPHLGHRDAGDPLHPVRPVRRHRRPDGIEAGGAVGDVVLVDQIFADRDVQQAVGQRQIGARHGLQVQWRRRAVGGAPRVDDDVGGAVGPAGVEVLHRRRHGVGRVGADQQHRLGVGDVGQRERQAAVDAEGPVGRGGRRRHAEPAVVVDGRRPQRHPGELAELVGLLVGQAAAAEAADAVAAVGVLRTLDTGDDAVQRVVPAGRAAAAWSPGTVAHQRGQQPLRVVEQVGGGPALGAEPAPVGREIVLRAGPGASPPERGRGPPRAGAPPLPHPHRAGGGGAGEDGGGGEKRGGKKKKKREGVVAQE